MISTAALLVLGLAVSRCSPLVASLPKSGLGIANAPLKNGQGANSTSTTAPTLSQIRLPMHARVVEAGAPSAQPSNLPSSRPKEVEPPQLQRLSADQVDLLQEEGQARLPQLVLESIPTEGEVIFEVSIPQHEIKNNDLGNFEADLRPASDGVWTLSILPASSAESQAAQARVKANLVGVQVDLSGSLVE